MRPFDIVFDLRKARSNLRKYGISFQETETVFEDRHAITLPDEAHSEHEMREVTIGFYSRLRLLLVLHTEIVNGEVRIISERKATSYEQEQYPLSQAGSIRLQ